MMSCHARSGNDVLLCMRGVLELCTKDFGTRYCIEFGCRKKNMDIVCKFWLEFADNLKIKPKSTREKYGVCIRPSKNVFCWLYIYIYILVLLYIYIIYVCVYWFPTWKSLWMIPTEAPTGRKLGLQAVRVSANPISLGISGDILGYFLGFLWAPQQIVGLVLFYWSTDQNRPIIVAGWCPPVMFVGL